MDRKQAMQKAREYAQAIRPRIPNKPGIPGCLPPPPPFYTLQGYLAHQKKPTPGFL